MSLPILIPPAINVQDLDYWADVVATPLHLMECLALTGRIATPAETPAAVTVSKRI